MDSKFTHGSVQRTFKIHNKMRRNKLHEFTENSLRLTVLERVQQLERMSENLNVVKKQIELTKVINEIIILGNNI